jgi:hypothetical protein
MKEEAMMESMVMGIGGFAVMMVALGLIAGTAPQVTYYTCSICGEQFTSMDDLEQHFYAKHPTEPIEIIWE